MGEGREREGLEGLIAARGLTDTVELLGMRHDVPDILDALDVAVCCSDWEGSPISVLEYMRAGLPTVATRVGGIPRILEEGRDGVLVPPGDPAGFAEAIGALLNDPERRAETGAGTREQPGAGTSAWMRCSPGSRPSTRSSGSRAPEPSGDGGRARLHAHSDRAPGGPSRGLGAPSLATGHPFATWEWNATWWERLGAGRELYAHSMRDGEGNVVAILPLYVAARRPVRLARFLGYADLMSPVCAPEHRDAAARALRELTRRPHSCRVLIAERMPGEAGWRRLGNFLRTDNVPLLRIEGRSWEELLATQPKFRGNLRRAEAKLVEEHGLKFRLASDPRPTCRRHCHPGAPARLALGRREHRVFAGELAGSRPSSRPGPSSEAGCGSGSRSSEGKAVAAWYGWRYAGVDWHYQSGRDPDYERLSVGTTLFVHTLREAFNDGMDAYNFLARA